MIDATDNVTRTLPGVPVAPPAPVRTTAAERMAAAGYEGPKDRWCCGNCTHSESVDWRDSGLRCTLLAADVRLGGCCRRWERA